MSILSFPVRPKVREKGLTLSDEMKRAIAAIARAESPVFITGGAGTGKSTLLRIIREEANPSLAVLAPTGIAAMNVRGSTIHSFFRFPPRLMTKHEFRSSPSMKDLLGRLSGIVIDEVSMVRADLLDAVDTTLKMHLDPRKPFGGLQIVFIGDLLQLPPVVTGDDLQQHFSSLYESQFFFDAAALQFCPLQCYCLTQTFRQTDPAFVALLNRIRRGFATEADLRLVNARVGMRQQDNQKSITLTATRKLAEDINRRCLDQLTGAEQGFTALVKGRAAEKEAPADDHLRLKSGARIMMLQNNRTLWQNGTVGTVLGFGKHNGDEAIRVSLPTGEHWVTRHTWEIVRYTKNPAGAGVLEEVTGAFSQFPLKLAWAATIHKSQGMTFDSVTIDLHHRVFEYGQLYVALSRCRSLEGITLTSPVQLSDMKSHPRVRWFEAVNSLA
ncbi:MAG: AAA family ATPase [Planctomycetaceae bacterium]|nr:AAA family ATPase [Planctomycetaceae bacterium]